MNDLQKKVLALKQEKGALLLSHYYQTIDIQEIADHVCDSYEMAIRAHEAKEKLLIICGVRFMAESAKILNPNKTVLMPSPDAGCPMADMITPDDVIAMRRMYPKAAVVCYVNSSAAVKAVSDVCCTSSSVVNVVKAIPEKLIIFVPDHNLGAYVATKAPEKTIILYHGSCPIHDGISEPDVIAAKGSNPGAKLLMHPECRGEVLKHADYIGSTAGMIKHALDSSSAEFIIGTEAGVVDYLQLISPEKRFYPLKENFLCSDMKMTRLSDVLESLRNGIHEITLEADIITAAARSLKRMVGLG